MTNLFINALERKDIDFILKIPKGDLHNHATRGGNISDIEEWAGVKIERLNHKFGDLNEMQTWYEKKGIVKPAFTFGIFLNEAGVTYCMITPVVLGIMIIFSKGIYKPLLSFISYVGFVFGLLNMMTWFAMQNQNWWMGVIHLPLLILSFYGLVISRKEKEILG